MKKYSSLFVLTCLMTFKSFGQGRIFDLFTLGKVQKESFEYQKKVLNKWKVSDDHLYNFHPLMMDSFESSIHYNGDLYFLAQNDVSPIHFRVFDGQSNYVSSWSYCNGNFNWYNILNCEGVNAFANQYINTNITLEKSLELIENNDSLYQISFEEYDYVIIAFWASYYGSAVRKVLQYIQRFQNECDYKVLFIKVNYNGWDEV